MNQTEKVLRDDASFVSKEAVSFQEQAPFVQSEAEKRLVRKMNYTFIPFVCVMLFIQFVDKSTLSTVSVIPEFFSETGIDKNQFGWLGSFFYIGFLAMQIPNNYMLQKFPVSKYSGVVLLIWGACLLSTAFATNFSQLAALRFLLGFFEAITYPAIFLLIATFYRRSEQVIWFGIMFVSNGFAGILGGFIGVGIIKMPTLSGIGPWQWAFIIFGIITCVIGIIYFFFLPDRPDSRWFRLTEEEKLIVEQRSRDNAVVPNQKINLSQIKEALLEPRFYCYCLISMFLNFQNGALTIFSSIIITDLGYSNINATLLNIPSSAFNIILILIATNISKKKNEIILVALCTCTISLIGLVCLAAIPSGGVKLIGLYLSWGCTSTYALLQTSISSNVSGYTKKIFYTSGNMVFYTFGNFVGPLLLRNVDAPRYFMGISVYIAANVLCLVLFSYVRYSYVKMNKKRNLDKNTNNVALPGALEDMTDKQNVYFVYRT